MIRPVFLPLLGALSGVADGLYWGVLRFAGPPIAAVAVLTFWILITAGAREDSLARVTDAFLKGRRPARILALLQDRRLGLFGLLALAVAALARWHALTTLGPSPERILPLCVACQAVSRAATIALAWIARPVGNVGFSTSLDSGSAIAAIVQAYAAAWWCGPQAAVWILAATAAIVLAARALFEMRLGGVNGDYLRATGVLVETAVLLHAIVSKSA